MESPVLPPNHKMILSRCEESLDRTCYLRVVGKCFKRELDSEDFVKGLSMVSFLEYPLPSITLKIHDPLNF